MSNRTRLRAVSTLALLAGALVVATPTTPPAAAATTAHNGVLLVAGTLSSGSAQHHGLVTVPRGGVAPAPVGTAQSFGVLPAADYAPDGRTFVELVQGASARELVVRDAATDAVVRRVALPTKYDNLASPRFSPDAARVALTGLENGPAGSCGVLLLVRVATGAVTVGRGGQADCGTFKGIDIDWSAATPSALAGRIVWTGRDEPGEPTLEIWKPGTASLVVHDADVRPGLPVQQPRWSPDGASLAVTLGDSRGGHLYLVDATTGQFRRLVGSPTTYDPEGPLASDPVFSPDGASIAYLWSDVDLPTRRQVRMVPVGGGAATILVRSGGGLVLDGLQDWQPVASTVAGPPPKLAGLKATPDDRRNRLRWTVPTVADFHRLVVYRSSVGHTAVPRTSSAQTIVYSGRGAGHVDFGSYPAGHGPGTWDENVINDRTRKPLLNGTKYFYSAFVVDASGEVSAASYLTATPAVPGATTAPGPAGRIRYERNPASGPDTAELWEMKSDGTSPRRITARDNAVLSPDGTMIAYVDATGLWRANANGTNPVRLAFHGYGGHSAHLLHPTWSPDSARLAFVRHFEAPVCGGGNVWCGEDTLFTVPAAGGAQVRVAGSGAPPTTESYRRSFGHLAWGPGLTAYPEGRIAFTETYHCPNASFTLWINCSGALMIVNPDGSEQTYVGRYGVSPVTFEVFEFAPAWSPDGRFLAYEHSDQQGDQYDAGIWVVKADGTEDKVLVDSPTVDESEPTWTADGQSVVYVRRVADGPGEIWRIGRNRSGARNLTRTPTIDESAPQATAIPD